MPDHTISESEWENYLANKVAVKSFKLITAVALPLIAMFAYLGWDLVKDSNNALKDSKERMALTDKLTNEQLKRLQNFQDTFDVKNKSLNQIINKHHEETEFWQEKDAQLEQLRNSYSNIYQSYVSSLFQGYASNLEKTIDNNEKLALKFKEIEATANHKFADFDRSRDSNYALIARNAAMIEKSKAITDSSLGYMNHTIANLISSEVIVLPQSSPRQYCKTAKCYIVFKDLDNPKKIMIAVMEPDAPFIPDSLKVVYLHQKINFSTKEGNYTLEVKEITSGQIKPWAKDFSVVWVQRQV